MMIRDIHRSAHLQEVAAHNEGAVEGVCIAIDELLAKAAAERAEGRIGGAYQVAADYLFATLFVRADNAGGGPP